MYRHLDYISNIMKSQRAKGKLPRSDIRRLQRDRFGPTNREYFFRRARDYYHRRPETDQTRAQNALRRRHIWSP